MSNFVYELDAGWSFDGNYIPHFAELNWYFGNSPVTYAGIQKIRIHGMSKGQVKLQVSINGMETDYISDYSTPQLIAFPKAATFVTPDFKPVTNYAPISSRGLSIQMKFEGSNTDITLPEPAHALQVLVLQTSPEGSGQRGN